MSVKKAKTKKMPPLKKQLQRDFVNQAKSEGLSGVEVIKRASIFPEDEEPKVVKWPKL